MPYEPDFLPLPFVPPGRQGLPYRRCDRCDYNAGYARHPQLHVTYAARSMCLDAGIADLVVECWRAGLTTTDSCQGGGPLPQPNPAEPHLTTDDVLGEHLPEVTFAQPSDVSELYRIVLTEHGSDRDEFARRVLRTGFNAGNQTQPDSWLLHTWFTVPGYTPYFTVFFARCDVNYVTELLARHNNRAATAS
jgi:hypothetical protein